MFEPQLEGRYFSHFQCFKKFSAGFTDVYLELQGGKCNQISTELSVLFLFLNQFDCNIDDIPVELNLELILQEDDFMKEKHREGKPVEFYCC